MSFDSLTSMDQGSRLSAVRLARDLQAQASLPGLPNFDEDDLYPNLTWLTEPQQDIEDAVFAFRQKMDGEAGEISTCPTLPDTIPAVSLAVSPAAASQAANAANAVSSKGKRYLYDVTSTYLEGVLAWEVDAEGHIWREADGVPCARLVAKGGGAPNAPEGTWLWMDANADQAGLHVCLRFEPPLSTRQTRLTCSVGI